MTLGWLRPDGFVSWRMGRPVVGRSNTGFMGIINLKKPSSSVDFPAFVGGPIQSVFHAIVNVSIQQMNAYGELLKSVA